MEKKVAKPAAGDSAELILEQIAKAVQRGFICLGMIEAEIRPRMLNNGPGELATVARAINRLSKQLKVIADSKSTEACMRSGNAAMRASLTRGKRRTTPV